MDLWPGRWAIFAFTYVAQRNSTHRNMDQEVWRPVCPLPPTIVSVNCLLAFLTLSLSQLMYPAVFTVGPMHSRGDPDRLGMACLTVRSGKSTDCSWGSVGFPDSDKVAWKTEWEETSLKNSLDCPAGGLKPSGTVPRPQLAAASLRIMAECLWKANRTALCGGQPGYF